MRQKFNQLSDEQLINAAQVEVKTKSEENCLKENRCHIMIRSQKKYTGYLLRAKKSMDKKPMILVFAGPNGSCKSTITKGFQKKSPLPGLYVNADDIKVI